MYEDNCFITLTYDNKNLPKNKSLDLQHFQLFMKRLRKKFGIGIRFFHCGEYGALTQRPHYHACIFNFDFQDKILWKVKNDNRLYTSQILNTLWPYGYCTTGEVTFDSAAYVARYIMKKITGELAEDHYNGRKPEYVTMSRRPGIGSTWLTKFHQEVYPSDFIIINGKKVKPPKYYDRNLEVAEPEAFHRIKGLRLRATKANAEDQTDRRLKTREIVKNAQDLAISA